MYMCVCVSNCFAPYITRCVAHRGITMGFAGDAQVQSYYPHGCLEPEKTDQTTTVETWDYTVLFLF